MTRFDQHYIDSVTTAVERVEAQSSAEVVAIYPQSGQNLGGPLAENLPAGVDNPDEIPNRPGVSP